MTLVDIADGIPSIRRVISSSPRHICLVPRPHYSARPLRFRSRGPSEFLSLPESLGYNVLLRNIMTEKTWEDAAQVVQGQDKRHYYQINLAVVTSKTHETVTL